MGALAAALVIESGRRGFFPFDQSIVFDGGYRILRGQVPYRDFLMPAGPIAPLLQAVCFALFGVSYWTYLLHAAVANAAAALLAASCVRRLFPATLIPSAAAGVVTAVWFYPLFGTPFFEQTAFLFHLLALRALLEGLLRAADTRRAFAAAALAGAASGVALLSKQNAGGLSVVCLCGLVVAAGGSGRTRILKPYLLGVLSCAAVFAAWLLVFSDGPSFVHTFFEVPLAEGLRRAANARFRETLGADLRSGGAVLWLVLAGPVSSAVALAADLVRSRRGQKRWLSPAARIGFAAAASLGAFQWLFIRVTWNLPDNSFGLAGLADVLALAAWGETLLTGRRALVEGTLAASLALPLCVAGRELARDRAVHDFWFPIHFRNAPVSRALAPVRWGTERDDPRAIRVQDVDELTDFLRREPAPFFVFPDFSVLYGIAGVEPPQPLLWFHGGLTYSNVYDKALDARIVAALERHAVRYAVVETVTFLGTEKRLRQFPLLEAYLSERFRETRRFGIFVVRERIP